MQAFPKIRQFFRRLSCVGLSAPRYFEDLSGKKIQNPSFKIQQSHAYRSYRKESACAVSKKDLQKRSQEAAAPREKKTRSRWRLGEHISPFETGGRSRKQKQLPVTLKSHRGEKHGCVFHRNRAFFVSRRGNIICLGLKKKKAHSAAIFHSEKTSKKGIPVLISGTRLQSAPTVTDQRY